MKKNTILICRIVKPKNRCKDKFFLNIKGQLHRDGDFAAIYHFGVKEWYRNGKLHREDGAYYVYKDDPINPSIYYHLHDIDFSCINYHLVLFKTEIYHIYI